jgi:hypothetical protein
MISNVAQFIKLREDGSVFKLHAMSVLHRWATISGHMVALEQDDRLSDEDRRILRNAAHAWSVAVNAVACRHNPEINQR